MPGKGKDLVGQIVAYLRDRGGEAELGLGRTSKVFGCTSGGLCISLRVLRERGIIVKMADGASKKGKYCLAEQFREGESWREVYQSFRKLWTKKSPSAPVLKAVEQETGGAGLNPLTAELVKVHEWASRVRAEIAPLKKRNEELEEKLQAAEAEIKRLADELAEANKDKVRHRENERAAEQRLMALRRENAVVLGGGSKEKILIMDNQGVQIEKKIL